MTNRIEDQSHLDLKYFVDDKVYNCPFCNRRNVEYKLIYDVIIFDWSNTKQCFVYFVRCSSCQKISLHLSFDKLHPGYNTSTFRSDLIIDDHIFYSVPTSFFVIDSRIPSILRELLTEAEGCVKMNFLTGASACTRKAIYELTVLQKTVGPNYEDKIKYLKSKYSNIDPELFDILCHIKDMTSDKIHEQSWDQWDSKHIFLFIETLKQILKEIYVEPDEKKKRSSYIQSLLPEILKKKSSQSSSGGLTSGSS